MSHRLGTLLPVAIAAGLMSPAALAVPGQTATCVGRFYCPNCAMTEPTMDPETSIFKSTVVNQYANGTWIAPDGTKKTVIICNDDACVTWQYTAGGSFLATKVTPNHYRNFVNQGDFGGQSYEPPATPNRYAFVYGSFGLHWCTDYFSDGIYTGTICD